MLYFQVRYDSRVVIYERKMFIRLATGHNRIKKIYAAYFLYRIKPALRFPLNKTLNYTAIIFFRHFLYQNYDEILGF